MPGPPEAPSELRQGSLEVDEGDPFVHHQPLQLQEGRRVGGVRSVPAINHPRRDDPDGRLMQLHGPDLHRRGVGPEQEAVPQIEGVGLVHDRVVQRSIEGHEVVPIRLHLGAPGSGEAQGPEDGPELVDDLGHRVPPAPPPPRPGKGEIQIAVLHHPHQLPAPLSGSSRAPGPSPSPGWLPPRPPDVPPGQGSPAPSGSRRSARPSGPDTGCAGLREPRRRRPPKWPPAPRISRAFNASIKRFIPTHCSLRSPLPLAETC